MSRFFGSCRQQHLHRQDGAWSWLVCGCCFLMNLLLIGFGISIGVVIPVWMKEFKSTREETAWVGSIALALASGLLSPIMCFMCNRFGYRFVAICGSLFCIASLLSSSFVTKLELLYFTHGLLFGIGGNFTYTTPFLVISEYFTKWRSLALCLITVGLAVGILTLGPFLQFMIDSFGWRITFRVMASLSVIGIICGLSFSSQVVNQVKPVKPGNQVKQVSQVNPVVEGYSNEISTKSNDEETSTNYNNSIVLDNNDLQGKENDKVADTKNNLVELQQNQLDQSRKGKYKRLRAYCSVWKSPIYIVIIVSSTLAGVVQYLPFFNLVKHGQELGFSADSVADLYIYQGISSIISRILGGVLLGFNIIQSRHLYQICLFSNGLVTIFLPMVNKYYGLVIYVVIFGASDGIFWAVLTVLVVENVNANDRSSALGMQQFLTSISLLLGPPFAGWIADIHDSYNPVFYMSGTISILAGLIVFPLQCRRKKVSPTSEEENNSEKLEKDMTTGKED